MNQSRPEALAILERIKKNTPNDQFCKVMSAVHLFDFLDLLRENGFQENWLEYLTISADSLFSTLSFYQERLDRQYSYRVEVDDKTNNNDISFNTGEVYYELWKDLDKKEYYKKTLSVLSERFSKNNISLTGNENILDDGCGSGRYSLALKEMGAKNVTGIDVSSNSIAFANKMNPFDDNVFFKQASVLELPFEDASFNFVFSNGVLHHTTDTLQGLSEIYRVLEPGGKCWLYLYGGKDSFFWDMVDCCRSILIDVPESYTVSVMKSLGYSSGRIFHRNDFFYVPINNRYYKKDIDNMLISSGFSEFVKLERGVDIDWDEIIHSNPNIDPYLYGEGEMRYFITK